MAPAVSWERLSTSCQLLVFKHILSVTRVIFTKAPQGGLYYLPHFTDEETERLRSFSWQVAESGFEPRLSGSGLHTPKQLEFLVLQIKNGGSGRGTCVAQWVEHPTSARVMTSRFVSSNPASGSLLSAQSSLWILCSPPTRARACSLSKINKC